MSVLKSKISAVNSLLIVHTSKMKFKKELIAGFALECYKCPVNMRDVFQCGDPFENESFKITCEKEEDICLKMSVRGEITV
jgi:hypothetical protein